MADDESDVLIECLVLSNDKERHLCQELKEEHEKGTIDLEEFSIGLFNVLEQDGDKFMSVFTGDDNKNEKPKEAD